MVKKIERGEVCFPFPALQNKCQYTETDFCCTQIPVFSQSQEKYQNVNMRRVHSASRELSPVLPFRRTGLPSSSPLMGTIVILYSVPGFRPGNKPNQPALGVSTGSRPLLPAQLLPRIPLVGGIGGAPLLT